MSRIGWVNVALGVLLLAGVVVSTIAGRRAEPPAVTGPPLGPPRVVTPRPLPSPPAPAAPVGIPLGGPVQLNAEGLLVGPDGQTFRD
jgi:hypothetical protein